MIGVGSGPRLASVAQGKPPGSPGKLVKGQLTPSQGCVGGGLWPGAQGQTQCGVVGEAPWDTVGRRLPPGAESEHFGTAQLPAHEAARCPSFPPHPDGRTTRFSGHLDQHELPLLSQPPPLKSLAPHLSSPSKAQPLFSGPGFHFQREIILVLILLIIKNNNKYHLTFMRSFLPLSTLRFPRLLPSPPTSSASPCAEAFVFALLS